MYVIDKWIDLFRSGCTNYKWLDADSNVSMIKISQRKGGKYYEGCSNCRRGFSIVNSLRNY